MVDNKITHTKINYAFLVQKYQCVFPSFSLNAGGREEGGGQFLRGNK
jgi:hypothetical protein